MDKVEPAWDVLTAPPHDGWWIRARRFVALFVAIVLVAVGALSITDTVLDWMAPADPSGPITADPPAVPESALHAAALPFAVDYLSWNARDKASRQVALDRAAAPEVAIDGWDGTGIQVADSPAATGLARSGTDRAVVTVRVRVTPFAPAADERRRTPEPEAGPTNERRRTPEPQAGPTNERRRTPEPEAGPTTPDPDAGPNVASGPPRGAGTPLQPRWLNIAIPLLHEGGRVMVSAPPALVGSPQLAAEEPALSNSTVSDSDYAEDTRDTVTKLLSAYGTGELEFIRAAGTSFEGLGNAAVLDTVTDWRVATIENDSDDSIREGHVTVTWDLSGNSGRLSCSYRVELKSADSRWYLLSIGAETKEAS